ncbi:WD repeat-containing protein 46 isoform X4 [Homo sapiens]|uniref:WD repeat-containing protein 46 isoform X4 n=1 Tax=Homo sapiens TaxID=9606 RepID=UPI0023E025E1|nr:WD repeat-containing protein 46 isoform X4 [Homo sapiens]
METAPKPGKDVPPKKDKLQTKRKKPRRYWEEETVPTTAGASPGPPRNKKNRELRPQRPKNAYILKKSRISKKPQVPKKPREWKNPESQRGLSGAQDPFPGPAPVPVEVVQKFCRIDKSRKLPHSKAKTRSRLEVAEAEEEETSIKAARSELLLAEEPGFLEGEDGEDTAKICQADIVEAVDIASAAKHFDLNLRQFGPYRLNYSRTGRHLAFGGRRGHVAALDWVTKKLMCEINVMEAVRDIRFLHSEALLAVAQNRWLHIYDNQGIELHCIRRCDRVTRLEFLPFHFLLATASETGFLTYLDVSVGKIVAALNARAGRLDVMSQNPYNAVIHLGHSNGTASLWSPAMKEPLAKILCHRGGVRAVAVDSTGAGEPNFDGLESNPYRSRKQRQEWEVKALLEKVPAELICLDPRALAEVDVISLEQGKKEQIERLGYDPQAKAPFQPKPKQKGRSSTASLVKRKRKVMDEEHRVNEHWHGPGLPQAAPSCLCLCPCQPATSHSVPVSSPSPVPRTRSGRAFSSSIIRRRRPSPRGPGHLPWTDLCAEPDSRVAWEQSLPKITCREMSVPWNKEVGAVWPLPQLGVDSCLLGWVGIKEESDFLDNVSGSSCGPVPLPLAKHEAILGSEGSVSCLYPHPIPCGCCGLSFAF